MDTILTRFLLALAALTIGVLNGERGNGATLLMCLAIAVACWFWAVAGVGGVKADERR